MDQVSAADIDQLPGRREFPPLALLGVGLHGDARECDQPEDSQNPRSRASQVSDDTPASRWRSEHTAIVAGQARLR